MKPCWVFMILLSCGLSHATESQSICTCKEQLKIVCIPAVHNVTVPCPELDDAEMTFHLYKEEEEIYNHAYPLNKNASNNTRLDTREDVKLQVNAENKTVNFMLTGVDASSYGIYKCERVIVYPPPLRRQNSTVRILVRVEGDQCKVGKRRINNSTAPPIVGVQKDDLLWIWILGLALLGIYGLIFTVIAVILSIKLKRTDSQSDYMNTKPKTGRDRKKKRGVQNPFPRYL